MYVAKLRFLLSTFTVFYDIFPGACVTHDKLAQICCIAKILIYSLVYDILKLIAYEMIRKTLGGGENYVAVA